MKKTNELLELRKVAEELLTRIDSLEQKNKNLEELVNTLHIDIFKSKYPDGELIQRFENVNFYPKLIICVKYVDHGQLECVDLTNITQKLIAYKMKHTLQLCYVGLKFKEYEKFLVLDKKTKHCIELDSSGLQDVECINVTSVI